MAVQRWSSLGALQPSAWVWTAAAQLLFSCVTVVQGLHLSVPYFFIVNIDDVTVVQHRVLCGSKDLPQMERVDQGFAHSNHSL